MFLSNPEPRGECSPRREMRSPSANLLRRRRPSVEFLEIRTLLSAPTIGLVSENFSGTNSAVGGALLPSISADGRYVAFESSSFEGSSTPAPSDLVSGLTVQNSSSNIYVRDLTANTTRCISVDYQTGTTGNDVSSDPIISANGSTVVFLSKATDLTANDNLGNNPNDKTNVFAWNRLTNTLSLVTVNYENTGPANDPEQSGSAANISVSANGRYVAYESAATDLVAGVTDNNDTLNVYVRDLQTNTTILVSRDVAGTSIGDGPSDDPVISSDGSTVAFDSLANNLDPNYSGLSAFSNDQVYVSTLNDTTDTVSATHLVSIDPTGTTAGNDSSGYPSLSDNGQMVAFQSSATNLVGIPVQGGLVQDVYVRNLATNTTQLVSVNQTGTADGDSSSFTPQISGDGNHVLFYSLATDLAANDNASSGNVFERNLTTNSTQLVSINYEGTNSGNATSHLANEAPTNASQQATGQISDNGQYVIFVSIATDLVPNYAQMSYGVPDGYDLYMRDTVGETTTLLSHAVGLATTGGTGESGTAAMTSDGQTIVFQSAFPGVHDNLVSNDTNSETEIFVAHVVHVATTEAATAISTTGATLNASVNPEGSATSVTFVYGTNPALTSGTTTTAAQSIGAGTTAVNVKAALTGLTAGTTYYFEVKATNAAGTTTGSIVSFTTTTATSTPPLAATQAATSTSTTGATLNASVNPEGSATSVTFVYGTNPALTSDTATTSAQSISAGTTAVAVTAPLTGLTAGTTYYFEVNATNAAGTTTGSIVSFATTTATSTAPLATTEAATEITTTLGTLNASVNPEGSATSVTFVYGIDPTLSSGTTTTSAQSIGAGTTAVSVTVPLSGLTAGTTYYFEVMAINAGGATTGSILSFATTTATSTAPLVRTEAATAISTTGATLNAGVDAEGSVTTVTFVYGTNPSLASGTTTTAQAIGAGLTAVAVTAPLIGLTAGTTYYFEVQAYNAGGTTTGSILSFATTTAPTGPPVATTQAATAISTTGTMLNSSVNAEGSVTTVKFVYGTDPALASGTTTITALEIGARTTAVAVPAPLTGLTADTTYYFEVKATNAGGTTTGSILSFSTAANPAVLQFSNGQFPANVTDGSAQVVVTRAGNPASTVTIVVSSPGGHDVTGFQSTITFAPNATSATVSIPLQNDGVPGEGDTTIPVSLSSPSAGASLGTAAVAGLIIHDNNPYPPPIRVTSVSTPTISIKVGTGKKAKTKKETVLQIRFSGNVAFGVLNSAAYHVKSGKTKKSVTTYTKNVPLSSFNYNPRTFVLTIYPASSLNLSLPEQLQITASLLTDAYGRPLDGNDDGQPGGDFFATFGRKGVVIR